MCRGVALAIINSNQWEAALRHHCEQMTPFRRMICRMPGTYVSMKAGISDPRRHVYQGAKRQGRIKRL